MGMELYGRTLSHSVLTAAIRLFATDPEMVGRRIFTTGAKEKVMGQTVGIDIEYYPRRMAKFRKRGAASAKNRLMTVKHIDVTLPLIKESTDIPASVLQCLREPGQESKAWGKAKVGAEQKALDKIIENRREWMRWQILQTGAISHAATEVNDISVAIDFGISGTHTPALTGTDKWSDATNSDPITNQKSWKVIYVQDSGISAKYGIMTDTVMGYLMNSTKCRALMGDRLKDEIFMLGEIAKGVKLTYIVYDEGYVPEGGSFTNFLGTDKFVLWSGETFPEYEGIFDDLDATTPGKFSKAFKSDDPSVITLLAGVNPLPSGERVNELFCADVA